MLKKVVNSKYICFCLIFIICFLVFGIINFNSKSDVDKIKIILKSDSYAYLPIEAKKFVQDVYSETGSVVLTEKNKKQNEPYLNPKYIAYLSLSEEEKLDVEVIPNSFVIDYVSDETRVSELVMNDFPSKYDLSNVGGKRYITPIKNQGSLGICWAMTTAEVAESFLMVQNNEPYDPEKTHLFSVRQIDYGTSLNGLNYDSVFFDNKEYENKQNAHRKLTEGGWFFSGVLLAANGLSLVQESVLPWNTGSTKRLANSILDYRNSEYEVDSTVSVNVISESSTEEEKNNYILEVKDYIMKYGGAYVGTGSPQKSCAFKNGVNGYVIVDKPGCAGSGNYGSHAMHLIGWDDDYEYAYCDKGSSYATPSSSSKCTSGTYKTGKGAWILRNSWGDTTFKDYAYVYLAYESINVDINFISSLSEMGDRVWDNAYYDGIYDFETGNIYYATSFENDVNIGIDNKEKIEKIKFYSFLDDVTYTIKIKANSLQDEYIKIIDGDYTGLYTIDLSMDNLIVDNSFNVEISANKRNALLNGSLSIFTSNVSKEPLLKTTYSNMSYNVDSAPSDDNPIYVKNNDIKLILEHVTKNISNDDEVSFRVMNGNEDVSSLFLATNGIHNMYMNNYIYSEVKVSSNTTMCGNTFDFQVLYNGEVLNSFPIKRICNSKDTVSNIRFYANDGSNRYIDASKNDLKEIILISDVANIPNEEIIGLSDWFDDNKFIESWNTKADGTGVSYSSNSLLVFNNLELYAQWSTPHKYNLRYICSSCSGRGKNEFLEYNKPVMVAINEFSISSSIFSHWIDKSNNIYYEEEIISDFINKTNPYNNEYFDLTAVFISNSSAKKITFDANGGVGVMSSIYVKSKTDSRLKHNLFSKEGYLFHSWNTKADGSGDVYSDEDTINTDNDIVLYAQWVDDYKIKVDDYIFDEEKLIISGISADTSIDNFISKITTNGLFEVEFDRSKNNIYTGSKIRIFYNDKLDSEIVTIVSGDTDGDGSLSIFDIVKINNHIIDDKKKLEGIYSLAGDFDNDGNLSVFDIVKINNKILEAK